MSREMQSLLLLLLGGSCWSQTTSDECRPCVTVDPLAGSSSPDTLTGTYSFLGVNSECATGCAYIKQDQPGNVYCFGPGPRTGSNPEICPVSTTESVSIGQSSTGSASTRSATTGPATTGPATTGPATTGPVTTGPATTGPATTGPVTTEPATTGPVTTGPATTGPATTGPVTTGPASTGPATSGPATTGPATTGPATTGPATTGPASTGQTTTGPVTKGPATTGPVSTGPATTGPATTGPVTTGPATTGPASTGPATTGPATTGPATTGPATTGPASTGPATTRPASTGPATTRPATTGPDTTGPASTGPATTGPASTGPATTGQASTESATTGTASTGPATTKPVTTKAVTTPSQCPGWTEFDGKCYQMSSSVSASWDDAKTQCEGLGGNLASIKSQGVQDTVAGLLVGQDVNAWIGATDSATEGTFLWMDGGDLSGFDKWKTNHPNNGGTTGQDCVQIRPDGDWDDVLCSKSTNLFVCEKLPSAVPPTTVPATTGPTSLTEGPTTTSPCPGWTVFGTKCYQMSSSVSASWDDAKTQCEGLGGTLAIIKSQGVQDTVAGLLVGQDVNAWIGATDSATEGTFLWMDGGDLSGFDKWKTNHPNNAGNTGQDCVQIRPDGDWDDVVCSKTSNLFVCEKST